MSIRFLKYKINGVRVPQFQLAYICDSIHPSQKFVEVVSWSTLYVVGKLRVETTGVGGLNKVREKNNLSYYYVLPNNKTQGYKEHII